MKVLITGVAGFIGKHLVNYLSKNGNFNVYGLDRVTLDCEDTNNEYIVADLLDNDLCRKVLSLCGQIDAIVHAASLITADNFNSSLVPCNCQGMLNTIQMAHLVQCKRFIYLSSIPVIGKPLLHPITEDHPTMPQTTYHASKLFGEHVLLLQDNKDLNPIILRLSSPIGKGMNTKTILPTFLDCCKSGRDITLFGKGTRKQNYIDVRDICAAIELALQSDYSGVYNIGGNRTISNYDLAALCIQLTNSKSSIIFNGKYNSEDDDNWDISIEKALKELHFEPKHDITNIIQSTLEWL